MPIQDDHGRLTVTEQQRNYNPLAEAGLTDLEVCEELGLDSFLANTPDLNEAAIAKVRKQNQVATFEDALDKGFSIPDARKLGDEAANIGERETRARLKGREKRTGKDWA